jgi:serine/threonine protein kinase
MEVYCTRPRCPRPQNYFADLDDDAMLRTVQQKYCTTCGMPLMLDGRYVPSQLLGRGGFGAAFLARDRRTRRMRQCVVKQFQPAGNLTPAQLQIAQDKFEKEAEVLEDIGNQNERIPDLYAYFEITVPSLQPGQQEKFFYLVQEYIEGQNLEEELLQKGHFSEPEVLGMLREILKVLQFVHERGIIHRDIKPSNIMRHRNGKFYLLDFGAVKQVTNVPTGSAGSSTGIYSMGFAPPEQMAGGEVYPSTDLYALAVTAVMLLTGKDPTVLFDGYSNQWKWRNLANVSPRLADILDKMLLPAANQRFQSAQEVLDVLDIPAQPIAPTHIHHHQPTAIPQPQPQPIQPQPQQPPPVRQTATPQFSTLELLAGAAFSGFEGALIAIALSSVLPVAIALVPSALILGILIFAQSRRWIEKFDLLIIPTITFAIIFFVKFLQAGLGIQQVIILAVAAGLLCIALTALFRLIYKVLSLIL